MFMELYVCVSALVCLCVFVYVYVCFLKWIYIVTGQVSEHLFAYSHNCLWDFSPLLTVLFLAVQQDNFLLHSSLRTVSLPYVFPQFLHNICHNILFGHSLFSFCTHFPFNLLQILHSFQYPFSLSLSKFANFSSTYFLSYCY